MFETPADRLALVRDAGELIAIDGAEVFGIFTDAYQPLPMGDHTFESAQPQVMVRSSDIPAAYSEASTVRVRGADWRVADTQPDGTGCTVIRLRKRQ